MTSYPWQHRFGAVPVDGGVEFRVWAPKAEEGVAIRLAGGGDQPLAEEGYGIWSGTLDASPGQDYYVLLDGRRRPDPCSRFQPHGIRGPSRVVDTGAFEWRAEPPPLAPEDLVVYELHVGCFTAAGTFDAATEHLPGLAALGVTAVELMPVAAFPGARGWGYDGIYIYAPFAPYGGPAGLARFVDAAHGAGLAVILDCVYNHLGTSGTKAMTDFGPYFTAGHQTGWGKGLNYDAARSDPVREWAIQNAEMWVRDYRVDGLRLDAVHAILDTSPTHLVAELAARVHAIREDATVIAETNANDPATIRPAAEGGWGVDAQWADDFHHSLRTLLTEERQGYYADFGKVADLAKAFDRPFVYDGRYSEVRERRVGALAADRAPAQFVVCSQNHDQVGNRALGDRMPPRARPLAALCVLLSPFTPLLFMGEEYGEEAPFQFFADHVEKKVAAATRDGRRREFEDFVEFAGEVPDPQDRATFERSKLTRREDPAIAALYRRLLALRRELRGARVEEVEFDEGERWLWLRRGSHEVVCNFADHEQYVPCTAREVVLGTHGEAAVQADGETVLVPALGGAVLR
ncbi:MAG TPA: malto-oligosyltrehalose trehalohydrolase [Solirubrobacterales bacterium]|nr:malto-oligosyltrehalose trehalohydrolase [Solirubrobacterales bacterium]